MDFSDDLAAFSKDAVDIAIRGGNIADDRVIARHLCRDEFKLVAIPQLIEQLLAHYQKNKLNAEDLLTCPALQFRSIHGLMPWWYQENNDWQKLDIKPIMTSNKGETHFDAILAGEGMAVYPHWWIRSHLDNGIVKEVPCEGRISSIPSPYLDMYILYQPAKYQIPKVKLCIDFLLQHLSHNSQE